MRRCAFCDFTLLICKLKNIARDNYDFRCEHFIPIEEIEYENSRFTEACAICQHAKISCTIDDLSLRDATDSCDNFIEFTYRS